MNIFKKLIVTVSNITEKKRIKNVINSIEFVLNYVAFDKNVSYCDSDKKQNSDDSEFSDSDSKQDFFDSEFSDSDNIKDFFDSDSNTNRRGLEILTANQMLSRLPITLAQL